MRIQDSHIEEILFEMCNRVGIDRNTINTHEVGWYYKASWTRDQQNEFRKWLENFFYRIFKNKKMARREANYFIFQYGWGLKE